MGVDQAYAEGKGSNGGGVEMVGATAADTATPVMEGTAARQFGYGFSGKLTQGGGTEGS